MSAAANTDVRPLAKTTKGNMRNDGAENGEKCALCGSQMNEGAIICASCGAKRLVVPPRTLGFLCLMLHASGTLLILLMLVPVFIGLVSGRIMFALLGFLGMAIGASLIRFSTSLSKKTASDVMYQRRSR